MSPGWCFVTLRDDAELTPRTRPGCRRLCDAPPAETPPSRRSLRRQGDGRLASPATSRRVTRNPEEFPWTTNPSPAAPPLAWRAARLSRWPARPSSAAAERAVQAAPAAQGGTPTTDQGIEHPTGAADAVIRIDNIGGFMLPEANVSQLPLAVLYGDGLLVTQGPQIAIFPPPALPNLRQTRLTGEGIQAVLTEANAAGLIGRDQRYDIPMIADAPYTVVTIQAGGQTTRVAVYALGADNPEWTPEERAAVEAIATRSSAASSTSPPGCRPRRSPPPTSPSPIERIQVLAQPYDQAGIDPNQDQPPVDWPIEPPLASFDPFTEPLPGAPAGTTCGVIEGDEAATLAAAAEGANALTPWVSEGEEYLLWLRPLLPDEAGCPPRDPAAEHPARAGGNPNRLAAPRVSRRTIPSRDDRGEAVSAVATPRTTPLARRPAR